MAERYDAGIVTAYGAAVRGGYTGTYDEFCAQQAGYAQSAAAVAQAKTDAEAAAQRAQNVAASIPADYSQMSEDVDTLKTDTNTLKEDIREYDDNVILVKNLVTEYRQGYVPATIGGKISESSNASYGYVKVKVKPNRTYMSTRPFSAGLSYFVDADGNSLGTIKGHVSDNTITTVTDCEWIYLTNAWGSYNTLDIVVLEGSEGITQANGYFISTYPYDTVVSVNIPRLIFGTKGSTASERLTALETFQNASEPVVEASSDFITNVNLYKNLVNNVVEGFYPEVSQGKVVILPNASYGYTKMPVKGGKTYTCSKNGFNGNFARVADENDNYLGKLNTFRVGSTGYVYAMPENAKYVYGSFSGFTDGYDIVFIEGSDNITSYSTAQYPYDTVYNIQIPLLENVPKVFKVGSTREYTTLKAGIEEATKYFDSVVFVDAETYDMETEFGTDFFTNYTSSSSRGIELKNRVHVIFASGAKVVFDGSAYGDAVHQYFSPFNANAYGFTLENAWVETKACRYCVHDDYGDTDIPNHNVYKHCHFEHDSTGTNWGAHQAIGGGFGLSSDIEIRECYAKAEGVLYPITYHNAGYNKPSLLHYKSIIVVTGCHIDGSVMVSRTGYSTDKSQAFISNNSVTLEPGIGATTQDAEDNVVMYKWNNIIRT